MNTDLIVIDSDITESELLPAWKWMQRIMHGDTVIMRQLARETGKHCQELRLSDVEQLAKGNGIPARAA
jgi:hypothetical protein